MVKNKKNKKINIKLNIKRKKHQLKVKVKSAAKAKKITHKRYFKKKTFKKTVREKAYFKKPKEPAEHIIIKPTEEQVKNLIIKGRSRGFLTETELLHVFPEVEE